MQETTLISAAGLMALQGRGEPLVVLDCSFELGDPGAGERAHAAGHLPQSIYAHLERDLSGPRTGRNGRHPLPDRGTWSATVGRFSIVPATAVVTYDAQGSPYAARAWWLLRWLGHTEVAVLDGGTAAWLAAGGALTRDAAPQQPRPAYPASSTTMPTVDAATLLTGLGRVRLFDARSGERYRGDVEPLDAVAGHIPGAISRFFKDNLGADGRFKTPAQLRAEFTALGGGDGEGEIVHQCGSGVTACHNLLAMTHAGLGVTTLYPGSWSEWCSDPARPVAKGAQAGSHSA